jgi:2,3,4,5-tetrahydropyridine-2-carboxylate N-succinyltransferase
MQHLQPLIEQAFEQRLDYTPSHCPSNIRQAVLDVIEQLDQGKCRVAEKQGNDWVVQQWIKKAVLLYFRITDNAVQEAGCFGFYDKVPLKYQHLSASDWQATGVRAVPGVVVRKGAYIGPNTVLMPSFINIGAYVDGGTLVDTWATVGSCAQIGKNVHLSGGVGIGGVLEPLQANPTIIEDHCFIGARSEIVEGVVVREGAVISMGVYLGQSTPIYNRLTGKVSYGEIPAYAVVVPGNLPAKDGTHSLYAAVIVKQVDEKTRGKISLNELLRDIE